MVYENPVQASNSGHKVFWAVDFGKLPFVTSRSICTAQRFELRACDTAFSYSLDIPHLCA